jgi:hypothetical protein
MSTEPTVEGRKSLAELAGSCPPAPVPDGVTPVEERAARWLHDTLRGYWGWADALDDARDLLTAINGPEPTWRDVIEASRNAGWTRRGSSNWTMWGVWGDEDIDDSHGWVIAHKIGRTRRVNVIGPGHGPMQGRSFAELVDPTPAEVLSAARLVGLGGDSDER